MPIVDIPSGLSKADFFKYIVRERALELGGEGIRKYDLIRWNLLGTALAESKANMLKMAASTPMVDPSYMAGYPSYCLSSTLPVSMYAINNTTSDQQNIGGLWFNSLYKTAPTATPSGTTENCLGRYHGQYRLRRPLCHWLCCRKRRTITPTATSY
jgi:hypothetical protein